MSDQSTYDVFLSHNSADKAAVEILARRLQEDGGLHPFLDEWHLADALLFGLVSIWIKHLHPAG